MTAAGHGPSASHGRRSLETTLDEAAASIPDGAVLGIGGALTAGHPMALVRAIARRGVRDLTVVAPTAGLEVDLLIAAGCVRRVMSAYVGGETVVPVGPVFRRAAEAGEIEIVDLDEAHCAMGLRAAAQRLPYLPWRGGVGTSYPTLNPSTVEYVDPLRGETLLAIPAIEVDVALLHFEAADRYGNGMTPGTGYMDPLIAGAAARTIMQCDRWLEREELRSRPDRIMYARNASVVRCPFGTHPYSCAWLSADAEHLKAFAAAGRSGGDVLDNYLQTYVREPHDHEAYLEAVGVRRLSSLMV